jgi:hypothetical protein
MVALFIVTYFKGITHPTMLARYNLRGQEASDDSDAFFFWLKNSLSELELLIAARV